MAAQNIRPNFYEGQYLGASDLTTAIDYCRIEDARLRLSAHTWGIAAGLQLAEKDSPAGGGQVDVYIQPGYAWDGFGRPIVLLNPVKIPAELFKSITYNVSLDGGVPPGRLFKVWLRYDESAAQQPGAGFEMCDAGERSSRIGETFGIEIGEYPDHTSHAPISVGGYTIDASESRQKFDPQTPPVVLYDESVPHQNFPTDNPRARWLIPLGAVRWSPNSVANQPGSFAKRVLPGDVNFSNSLRRYIGVVAGSVEASNGFIRLHDRTKPYSTVASTDLVWVEGSMRVENGDVSLFGGKLDFKDQSGDDGGVPLFIQRANVAGSGDGLQAVIGKSDQGHNTFAVGPLDGVGAFVPKLIVRDDGKVGIGTATPNASLQVVGGAIMPAVGNSASAGIQFPADPGGGGGDEAFIRYSVVSGESTRLLIGCQNDADDSIGFFQFGAERMTISRGNVGIGTNTPVSTLHVAGDVTLQQHPGAPGRALPVGATMCWSDGTWLRLNQNLDHTKPIFGVHTPGLFASGSLNVGGLASWGDPGPGNVWISNKLSIGTATPSPGLALDVQGDMGRDNGPETLHLWGSRIGDTGDRILFLRTPDHGIVHFSGTNSNVVIGGLPVTPPGPLGALHVDGSIFASGAGVSVLGWSLFSDERLKKEIEPLTNPLSSLLRLRGVRFFWKEPAKMGNLNGPQTGLIAQEVEKIFPDWVSDGPDGNKTIVFRGFEALVVEALRELNASIDDIKARLDKLEQPPASSKKKTTKA